MTYSSSNVTAWQIGDPLSPTVLNTKLLPLLSDLTTLEAAIGGVGNSIIVQDTSTPLGPFGTLNFTGSTITPLGGVVTVAPNLPALRAGVNAINGVINVKDAPYNAMGDGVTDDTAAIQAAINACAVGNQTSTRRGGDVYLPPGYYMITSKVTLLTGIRFHGASTSDTLLLNYVVNDDMLDYNADATAADVTKTIQLDNFSTLGRVASTGSAIRLRGTVDYSAPTIRNLYCYGNLLTAHAIRINNSIGCEISRVYSQGHTGDGFLLETSNNIVTFISTYAIGNGGHGYNLSVTNLTMESPGSDSNAGDGYRITGTTISLHGVEAENNGPAALRLLNASRVFVSSAGLFGSSISTDGIILDGTQNVFLANIGVNPSGGTPSGYNLKLLNAPLATTVWNYSFIAFTSGGILNAGNADIVLVNDSGVVSYDCPVWLNKAVYMPGLPTSAAGLFSGGIWQDTTASHVLKVVP